MRYPGIKYRYVICDVCGGKFHVKDTVQITDRYNTLNKLIVCRKDADKTNPQAYPVHIKETLLTDRTYVRSESPDSYIVNSASDRVPSAPGKPEITINPLSGILQAQWLGPQDPGSSPITGYKIITADPQVFIEYVVTENTNSETPYYLLVGEDTAPDEAQVYAVAAYNSVGMGPYSEWGYFPYVINDWPYDYLITTPESLLLLTNAFSPIIIEKYIPIPSYLLASDTSDRLLAGDGSRLLIDLGA